MSDLNITCPACRSAGSAIGLAVQQDEPCPYCGLPAEVFALIDAAEERGLEQRLIDRAAAAEKRAAEAERALAVAQGVLSRLRLALSDAADEAFR